MNRSSECTVPIWGVSPTGWNDDEGAESVAQSESDGNSLIPLPATEEHRIADIASETQMWCTFDLLSCPFPGVSEGGAVLRNSVLETSAVSSSTLLDTMAAAKVPENRSTATDARHGGVDSGSAGTGPPSSPPLWSAAQVFASIADMGPSFAAEQPNNTSFMSLSFDSKSAAVPLLSAAVAGTLARAMRPSLGPSLATSSAAYGDERLQTSPTTRASAQHHRGSLPSPDPNSPLRRSPRPSVADSHAARMSGALLWPPTPTVRQGVKLVAATLHVRRSLVDDLGDLSSSPTPLVNVTQRPCAVRLFQVPSALSDARLREVALHKLRALLKCCTVDLSLSRQRDSSRSSGGALRHVGEASSSSLYNVVSAREFSAISAMQSEAVVETRLSDTLPCADSSHDQLDPSLLTADSRDRPLHGDGNDRMGPDSVPLGLPVLQVHLSDAPTASRLGCAILSVVHPLISRGNVLERYREWVVTTRPSPADREVVIREIMRCCLVQLREIHARGAVHGNVKATNLFSLTDIQSEVEVVKPAATLSRESSSRDAKSRTGNRSSQSLYDAAADRAEGRRSRSSAKNPYARSQEQRRSADPGGHPSWARDVVVVDGTYRRIESVVKSLIETLQGQSVAGQRSTGGGQSTYVSHCDNGDSAAVNDVSASAKPWFQALQDDYVMPPECLAERLPPTSRAVSPASTSRATEGRGGCSHPDSSTSAAAPVAGTQLPQLPSWSSSSSFPFSMSETVSNTDALLQSPAADIWNLGLTAIHLADGGFPPWLRRQARPLPSLSRSHWSRKFSSFVQSCVALNPAQRPSPEKLLEDPWFSAVIVPSHTTESGQIGLNAALPPPPPIPHNADEGGDAARSPSSGDVTTAENGSSALVVPGRFSSSDAVVAPETQTQTNFVGGPAQATATRQSAVFTASPRRATNASALAGASPSHAQRRTVMASVHHASSSSSTFAAGASSSYASRPLRHLFGESSDGSGTVFLPQRNVLRTCADMYVACLQHVASIHERLDAKRKQSRGLLTRVSDELPAANRVAAGSVAQPPTSSSSTGLQSVPAGGGMTRNSCALQEPHDPQHDGDDISDDGSDGGVPPPALAQTVSGVVHDDGVPLDSRLSAVTSGGSPSCPQTPHETAANRESRILPQGGTPGTESSEDDTGLAYDADEHDPDPHRHRLFLSAFLAAVEACRRETLAEMGYFVVTPSPAVGELVLTRSGAQLTARQRQEVQLVEDRYASLIQAYLDLHAASSISCDRWLIGILAATTRHGLTQDYFIPVKSWWIDRLAAMHQRPLALLTGRLGASTTSALPRSARIAAGGVSAVSSLTASSRRTDNDTSHGIARGGSSSNASPAGAPLLSSEPTPTECNDYLFCKWLTLASITVEER